MNNTYFIGDVHGCYFTLMSLIKKLPKDSKLIFLGDLCDKGNHVKEVIQYIIDNNHTVVKGNHDYMMEQYLKKAVQDDMTNIWTSETWGGYKTVNSYKDNIELMEKHLSFISTLPYYIDLESFYYNEENKLVIKKYYLTHGFGAPYQENKDSKKLMSNRVGREYSDWEDFSKSEKINVFGHCDFEEVLFDDKYIGIDTGAVYGRKLTAMEINTHKLIQEDVHKEDIV